MITVIAFGTFDGIHGGHASYLKQAKERGGRLIVIIARDRTVLRLKGRLPQQREMARLRAVEALPYVDEAILGGLRSPYAVLKDIRPDIIALGYDQTFFTDKLAEKLRNFHLRATIIRCRPFKPHVYKSSRLNDAGISNGS